MKTLSPFSANVIQLIQKIPQGKVATYGQIAKLAGKPQGSRGVSWILNSCSKAYKLPWFRVLNSKGSISFSPLSRHFLLQKKKLQGEGVEFIDHITIDLENFQWKPARGLGNIFDKNKKITSLRPRTHLKKGKT